MPGAPQRNTGRTTATCSSTPGSSAGVTVIADSIAAMMSGPTLRSGDPIPWGVGPSSAAGVAIPAWIRAVCTAVVRVAMS